MTLVKRRITLFFTVILFVLLSTGLVFYAMGYRFNSNYNEIRQVGIIDVANTPANTDIFIDGEKVSSRSPYQIKDLYPGTYRVKTEKEGYSTWEKDILVNAREVTWIRNARNFINNPERKTILSGEITSVFQSENKQTLYLIEKTETQYALIAYSIEQDEPRIIEYFDAEKGVPEIKEISSDSSTALILFTKDETQNWISIGLNENVEITDIAPEDDIERMSFYPNSRDTFVYISENGTLTKTNRDNKSEEIASSVTHFHISNRQILYIQSGEEIIPAIYALNTHFSLNERSAEQLITLPSKEITSFEANSFNDLAINTTNKGLLLFDNERNRIIELGMNIQDYTLAQNTRKILFHNGTEVFFYEMSAENEEYLRQAYQANQVNLLTRYSNPIQSMGFYVDEAWALIALENEIKFMELDERSSRNTHTLAALIRTQIFQQKDGEDLFFYNTQNKTFESVHIFDPVNILGIRM